ncbi:MAG: ATP phosphoribosyltransferase regulatory subunit [Devosiaceae bacterium]|nr:ATP phosphoribosyltransferase regulatory subunit [Devosiaceae bacterium MH13]
MSRRQITELLETSGYLPVETPVLQPADVFLDLAGEDIRARLFTTEDEAGRALCLRPEHTIPICRHHIATGEAARPANYGYLGPAFRFRPDESGEFLQAGIESIGREDKLAADAEVMALSLSLASAGGLTEPSIILGDASIVTAFVDGLGFSPRARRRLRRALGSRVRMEAALAEIAKPVEGSGAVTVALAAATPEDAQALVEDMMQLARIRPVGGRTAQEIAARFIAKAESAAAPAREAALTCLEALIHLQVPAPDAPGLLQRLADVAGLDLGAPIARFADRLEAIADRNLKPQAMTFCGWAGGRLDYYTGFSFELRASEDVTTAPAASGGRFDGLMERLGAPGRVPAVGAALWLDRLPQGMEP